MDLSDLESPFEDADVEQGRDLARASYIASALMLPLGLLPYFQKNNEFSFFHGRQSLFIWLLEPIFLLLGFLNPLFWVFGFPLCWVLVSLGLRQVAQDQGKALPLISQLGEKVFPRKWVGE